MKPESIKAVVLALGHDYGRESVERILAALTTTPEYQALVADAERVDRLQGLFVKGDEFHIVMCMGKNEEEDCDHPAHPHFEAFDWGWRCEPLRTSTLRELIDKAAAIDAARNG